LKREGYITCNVKGLLVGAEIADLPASHQPAGELSAWEGNPTGVDSLVCTRASLAGPCRGQFGNFDVACGHGKKPRRDVVPVTAHCRATPP